MDTKKAIAEAMIKLEEKKNLDQITVTNLIKECGISRQTFYYHFKDTLDVVEYIFNQFMVKYMRESTAILDWEESVKVFMSNITSHQAILRQMLNSKMHKQIEIILFANTKKYIRTMVEMRIIGQPIKIEDVFFLIDIATYSIVGYLIDNIDKNYLDIDAFATKLLHLISSWK